MAQDGMTTGVPSSSSSSSSFLPLDKERMDEAAEFLDYPVQPSASPSQCELGYSEFVETQWAKDSGCGGESPEQESLADEVGSDTESVVVVGAPLHGPTTVRCVCVCKRRGCEFVKGRTPDAESVRESPVGKMPLRYRVVTWLTAIRPHGRRSDSPVASVDQMDAKVHPEKRSRIVQMFRRRGGGGGGDAKKHLQDGEAGDRRRRRCRRFQDLSILRSLVALIGLSLIALGVTYDHGVKHGVDSLLQGCWSWLRTSYMNFGDEFVSYNSLFFRMSSKNEALYGEPYPKYGTNGTKKKSPPTNGTSFRDAINKVDPKFLFVLEGLKLSVQMHFFSIDEKSDKTTPEVLVHDRGPLFFRISFRRTDGLYVDYLPERSNMSLSTPFLIYDLMKMILLTNEFPYFGMHMHDYIETTPSALFTMIIDNLKKFNVDTTFLSSIQAQIQKGRRKRSPAGGGKEEEEEEEVEEEFSVHVPTEASTEVTPSASEGVPGPSTELERLRRSTEEPSRRRSAWKSLSEISRKIFLPLPLDTRKSVLLPVPFLERNLTLRYRHAVSVLGLPGYQFILGNDITRAGTWEHPSQDLYPSLSYSRVKDGEQDAPGEPHLQKHRYEKRRKPQHHRHSKHQGGGGGGGGGAVQEGDSYKKSFNDVLGVVDLEPLMLDTVGRVVLMGLQLRHYPFWVSPPHFLSLTDQMEGSGHGQEPWNATGGNANLVVGVEGISANESIHGSFIYYHPILGVPINASLAVQVGVRPPEGMLHAHKLVPIMWSRVQVEEIPLTLWYILWAACHLRETIMACLIGTGVLVMTCAFTCRRKRRLPQRRGSA